MRSLSNLDSAGILYTVARMDSLESRVHGLKESVIDTIHTEVESLVREYDLQSAKADQQHWEIMENFGHLRHLLSQRTD